MLGKMTTNFAGSAVAIAIAAGAAWATGPGIPRGEKTFGRLDVDSNGKLTIAEIHPKAEKRFFRIDNDADKSVGKAEIELWLNQTMERRRDRRLARLDADKNGVVSAVEFETFLGSEFKKADKNSDGGVTFDEASAIADALDADPYDAPRLTAAVDDFGRTSNRMVDQGLGIAAEVLGSLTAGERVALAEAIRSRAEPRPRK
ncbi:MAG: hypothetical protein M3N38_08260 [Pseudomonadota bacterium]|nr:hypothetical protein [Pseudomonadota bacterium]